MHNHSYENEFNLHVNEISFSYERMSTKTRFEKEAKGNSEMAYYIINPVDKTKLSCTTPHRRSTTVSLETYLLYSLVAIFAIVTFQYLVIALKIDACYSYTFKYRSLTQQGYISGCHFNVSLTCALFQQQIDDIEPAIHRCCVECGLSIKVRHVHVTGPSYQSFKGPCIPGAGSGCHQLSQLALTQGPSTCLQVLGNSMVDIHDGI